MTETPDRPALSTEDFMNSTYDASRAHVLIASGGGGGLATGPHDPVSGQIEETPAEPMERPGTENAEDAIDGPRLTPQGRTGEGASEEDDTDPMGGTKIGQRDKAEG